MVDLIVLLILLALGYTAGTLAEKRHYRSINAREKAMLQLPVVTIKWTDDASLPAQRVKSVKLVYGGAVISIDYFKRLLAKLRNIFGGTIKSYETLIDRARREAVLRMKEQAGDATIILNLRIETATIGRNAHKKGVGCVEALAYGTALTLEK